MEIQKFKMGELLRRAREDRGLSVREVSSRVGIPKSTIHYYETNGPSMETIRLLTLLHHYNFTLRYIIEGYQSLSDLELCQELLESTDFGIICRQLTKIPGAKRKEMVGSLVGFLETISNQYP